MRHSIRSVHVARSRAELLTSIETEIEASAEHGPSGSPSVVFIFTGQGLQFSGMGKQLFETNDAFRQSILTSDRICQQLGCSSFLEIINKPDERISKYGTLQI